MQGYWKYSLVLALSICATAGCYVIHHKSKLTLKNEPFDRQKITFRLDGYYYREEEENTYFDNRSYLHTLVHPVTGTQEIIFYADGYVNYWSGHSNPQASDTLLSKEAMVEASLGRAESTMRRMPLQVFKKNPRYTVWDWGLYRQRSSRLKIQYYFNVFGDYEPVNLDVVVLNDTTLNIIDQCCAYVPELSYPRNDQYHFRKFAFKPDSSTYLRDHIERFGEKK